MPIPDAHGLHKRSLLRDDVYESIRDAIVAGTLAPGERLRDAELEQWLGVSRTPIREALLRLERAGLVVTVPGRATMVSPTDDTSTANAQQVAASLHELAARLAVDRADTASLAAMADQMAEANSRFEAALDAGDVDEALAADDEFHAAFLGSCGNPMVGDLLEQVTPLLRRAERSRFASFAARESVAQHAQIIAATRQGDAEAVAVQTRQNWLTLSYVSV